MKGLVSILSLVTLLGCTGLAHAQATRTWVSGVGDDANPCSRTAPCKTFAGAISKTAAAGEINCIDPGGFGTVTITKSIAIICDNVEAGIAAPGTNGINVNAGATDVVYLSGLDIQGYGSGVNGINFLAGAALNVHKTTIRGFAGAAPNGNGVLFQPSGTSELFLSDVRTSENGQIGVEVRPSGSGTANVSIERVQALNNAAGIRANGTATTGAINVNIQDSVVSGQSNAGINAVAGASPQSTQVMVAKSAVVGNGTGLIVAGGATLRVGETTVTGNTTGINNAAGTLNSYGTNQINGNANDGPVPVTIPLR